MTISLEEVLDVYTTITSTIYVQSIYSDIEHLIIVGLNKFGYTHARIV